MAQLKNTTVSDTGFLQLPVGTTAHRPANPEEGMIRFNTDNGQVEGYNPALDEWRVISDFASVIATGGTVTDIVQDGIEYRVHAFISDGTFEVTRGGKVEYLIVAGGGGGGVGSGGNGAGGAGGAGGLISGKIFLQNSINTITVGAGAASLTTTSNGQAQSGNIGENSSAFGFTAIRGGPGGVSYGNDPSNGRFDGGSGGGEAPGAQTYIGPGQGTPGQGNNGGDIGASGHTHGGGGGGGGAGEPGGNGITGTSSSSSHAAGNGGAGLFFGHTFGTNFGEDGWFAGGGGGGQARDGTGFGSGGIGGGGRGSDTGDANGRDGTEDGLPNTGGGGGGGGTRDDNNVGGGGGSGIVIIRYRLS